MPEECFHLRPCYPCIQKEDARQAAESDYNCPGCDLVLSRRVIHATPTHTSYRCLRCGWVSVEEVTKPDPIKVSDAQLGHLDIILIDYLDHYTF